MPSKTVTTQVQGDAYDVCWRILEACKGKSVPPTAIIDTISYHLTKTYLSFLLERGLLMGHSSNTGKRREYSTTEKGVRFLQLAYDTSEFLLGLYKYPPKPTQVKEVPPRREAAAGSLTFLVDRYAGLRPPKSFFPWSHQTMYEKIATGLIVIYEYREISPTTLRSLAGMNHDGTGFYFDVLEKNGLIDKKSHGKNYSVHVFLTQKGKDALVSMLTLLDLINVEGRIESQIAALPFGAEKSY